MYEPIIAGIRQMFGVASGAIPLHIPWFNAADEEAVAACVRSTFVSSVGKEVTEFEQRLAQYTGSPYAVATVNGTAALHIALLLAGAAPDTLVITQAFTFIATCNAIHYTGARPYFLDIDPKTLGLSADALSDFLANECEKVGDELTHRPTGKRIVACIPMHSFGHPTEPDRMADLCSANGISLIEDAAESLGSTWQGRHTGTFGRFGTVSFNGNKIITCGGGGAILCSNEQDAKLAKHLTTQAKLPHPWKFEHDQVAYNYRMPNLNAALALSQMDKLEANIVSKRKLAQEYADLFEGTEWQLFKEPAGSRSNYWLNAVLLNDGSQRDEFLRSLHQAGILARPAWGLMQELPMFKNELHGDLTHSIQTHQRLVCLPSSARS